MTLSAFTQKALLPIWALLIFLALLDINTRLISAPIEAGNHWQTATLQQSRVQRLKQVQAKQIISNINDYESEPEIVATAQTEQTLSEAEQAAQLGDLNQLYAGNIRFRLMGIFANNGHFAVLLRKNFSENTQETVKVQVGESLKSYKLSTILANKLLLEAADGRQISLNLFNNK